LQSAPSKTSAEQAACQDALGPIEEGPQTTRAGIYRPDRRANAANRQFAETAMSREVSIVPHKGQTHTRPGSAALRGKGQRPALFVDTPRPVPKTPPFVWYRRHGGAAWGALQMQICLHPAIEPIRGKSRGVWIRWQSRRFGRLRQGTLKSRWRSILKLDRVDCSRFCWSSGKEMNDPRFVFLIIIFVGSGPS